MKRILVGILFALLIVPGLWAQDEASWFVGKPIVGFQFQGLKQVAEGELVAILAPYREKPFSYDIYWEMQNKLYALDFFESVAADALPGDDEKKTVIISFQIKELPLISRIIIVGNNNLPEKEVKDAILVKERGVWSEGKVKVDVEAIKSLYRDKGFLDAEITYTFVTNEVDGMITLTFNIKEGAKTTVKKILFSGNQFASEGTLKGLLQTKEPALFANSDFLENKLKEDTEAIQNYYHDHGYYFAKVEKVDKQLELNEAEQRKYIILTFYIKEGNQYTYGATTFQGNNIFTTEKLSGFMTQKTGEILSKKKFKEGFMQVANLYYDNGYVTTQINPKEKVDEGKKVISFDIIIVEGERSHVGRIIIQGNTKTKESVIRRELPFQEGDVFNRAKIQHGYINLMRTGFFSRNIVFEPSPGSEEGLIDIVITVEETQTANLEVGGSIVPSDFPFTAYANLVEKNFLGMGLAAGLNFNLTALEQSLSASYEDNWLFGERLLGGINFTIKHQIVQNVPEDILGPTFNGDEYHAYPDGFLSWEDYQAALDAGLGIPSQYTMQYHSFEFKLGVTGGYSMDILIGLLGLRIEPSMSLSYLTYDPVLERPFSNILRSELNRWLLIDRLGFTVYLQGTDIPHNPEKGFYVSQFVGFVGDFLFGDRHYVRLSTEAELYWKPIEIPVDENWTFKIVLALHTQLSFVLPPLFGISPMTAVEEDFYRVDGMFVGRGWNIRTRGKVLWDNKIELRMPILQDTLWFTIFFLDIVGLWTEPSDFAEMTLNDFYFSMGAGIRLTVPGMPIRLYLAKRFKIVDGAWEWQVGALKFGSDQASLDLVFSIDISPF